MRQILHGLILVISILYIMDLDNLMADRPIETKMEVSYD